MGGTFGGHGKLEDFYDKESIKLGTGAFATVWRAKHKGSGAYVAIKELDLRTSGGGRNRAAYEKEVRLLSSVSGDNVANLHRVFEDDSNFHLVLDYCDGGDLGDKIIGHGKHLKTEQAKNYMRQIFSAIHALHAVSIIHRDVKPDNFLIATGDNGNHILKLSDFGIADTLPEGQVLTVKCGTPAFMSPEQHILPAGNGYGLAVDLWASGIILFMLLEKGRHPFLNHGCLDLAKLKKGKSPTQDAPCATLFLGKDFARGKDLCNTLLFQDPDERPTAVEALHSLWLTNDTAWERPTRPTVPHGSQFVARSKNQGREVFKEKRSLCP